MTEIEKYIHYLTNVIHGERDGDKIEKVLTELYELGKANARAEDAVRTQPKKVEKVDKAK